MIENSIILNLGLETIPLYQFGGSFSPLIWLINRLVKEQSKKETDKESKKDVRLNKSKAASTGKKSTTVTTRTVTTSAPQSSTPSSIPTSNMDWMTDYSSPQTTTETTLQEEVEEREPFNAVNKVWNDEVLSKVDTAVASRYLRNNLQDLLNMYNMKVAETIGQKRS